MSVQLKDMRNALDTAADIGFDAPSPPCSNRSTPAASNTA
jgi:hypothetical protein